jgi:hypothetical protein
MRHFRPRAEFNMRGPSAVQVPIEPTDAQRQRPIN